MEHPLVITHFDSTAAAHTVFLASAGLMKPYAHPSLCPMHLYPYLHLLLCSFARYHIAVLISKGVYLDLLARVFLGSEI
jgi:hypothetical protein